MALDGRTPGLPCGRLHEKQFLAGCMRATLLVAKKGEASGGGGGGGGGGDGAWACDSIPIYSKKEKKKKDPRDLGCHSLELEPRFIKT